MRHHRILLDGGKTRCGLNHTMARQQQEDCPQDDSHPDSQESSLNEVKKITKIILRRKSHNLSKILVSATLTSFSSLMMSNGLITVDVTRIVQSDQFEAIMQQYEAVIPLKQDMKSLEEHCKMLLDILEELGGPAIEAANVLRDELKKKVKEVTGVAFLSDNSEVHPSIPPQGKRNSEGAIPRKDINHSHEIERSRSDDHLDHRKRQPIAKLPSVTEQSPGASNTNTHFSGSSSIRPSSLTPCEKVVADDDVVVDSGVISFPVSSSDHQPMSQQYNDAISSPEAPIDYTMNEPVNNTENVTDSSLHVVPGTNNVLRSTVNSNGEATPISSTNMPSDESDEPNHKQPTQSTEEDQSHVFVLTNGRKSVNPTCQLQLEKAEADSTRSSCNHTEEIREKNCQIKKLENECRQIEEELECIRHEKANLVKSKDDQIQRIKKELEAAKKAYELDIRKTVAESDQKIKEKEKKLEEKNEEFQEAKAKLQEARKDLMETKKEKEEELQEVKKEFKEYKEEKCSELRAAKSEHKKEREELKCELQEKKDEMKEIKKEKREELTELETELSETKKQLRKAKQEIKLKDKELEEKDEELEEVKKELKTTKQQLDKIRRDKEDKD